MRVLLGSLLSVLPTLLGCAGASPDPRAMADRELPALTDTDPEGTAAAETEILSLLAQQQFDRAEARARELLARQPRSARARAALGWLLVRRSWLAEPPDLFLRNAGDGESLTAVGLAPGDPVVGLLRGRVLADIGHLTAAAAAAEDCLGRIAPTDAATYLDLLAAAGEWCYELGEEQRAATHLRELVGRRPKDATALYRLGASLLRTAAEPATAVEAAGAFARCAALQPDDSESALAVVAAHVRAAELHRRAGRAAEAATELDAAAAAARSASERFPALAEARFRLGVVADLRSDPNAATASYQRALELDPDHLGALLNLAGVLAGANTDASGSDEARELWRRALAVDAGAGRLSGEERRRLQQLVGDGQ